MSMESIYLAIPLASLLGAILAGFFGKQIGRTGAHWVTILGVGTSFVLSLIVLKDVVFDHAPIFNQALYTWMVSDGIRFEIGFLIDGLTSLMMVVVTSRIVDGAYLYRRLYARRSGLSALLQLHFSVHLRYADAGDVE